MKSLAQAKLKRARAVELAAEGKSYSTRSPNSRVSGTGGVRTGRCSRHWPSEAEGVDHLREVEAARLNDLRAAIWEKALGGDPTSVALAVKIIHQEIRLFGLDSTQGLARNGPVSMMTEDWGISTSSLPWDDSVRHLVQHC